MKLALVTETFPPEVNGVSMTLGRLCDGLASAGWRLEVVRPVQEREEVDEASPPKPYSEFLVAAVPLPGYKGLRMGEPAGFSLHRMWKADRPDVVHIATEGPLGLAALAAASLLKIPVTSTFHTNFDQYSGHYNIGFIQKLMSGYLRWAHNRCACTLAPTRQMADELAAEGYRNTGVLTRGVDTKLFAPERRDEGLRRSWGVEGDAKAILYVGRIAKEKNIDLSLQAYAEIRKRFPGDRLVLVGGGPELERLRRKYPEACYAGMRQGEDLARHYASGDLFLFASETETFGNVVTEAMASGCAVCTYDYAVGRQYVRHGENGMLAPLGDANAYIESALALRSMSEAELVRLRQAARATAEGISWEAVVASFQASLRAVIERSRAGQDG